MSRLLHTYHLLIPITPASLNGSRKMYSRREACRCTTMTNMSIYICYNVVSQHDVVAWYILVRLMMPRGGMQLLYPHQIICCYILIHFQMWSIIYHNNAINKIRWDAYVWTLCGPRGGLLFRATARSNYAIMILYCCMSSWCDIYIIAVGLERLKPLVSSVTSYAALVPSYDTILVVLLPRTKRCAVCRAC
jgi:hypothetical protein